ncbi:hypothetical protein ABT154_08240 [Streptomyces sp. NPDC001728]|uniref:hypothetical protein n=1 Tax=Streptomyces sp. NPDC001728 TaxID=3154396 RepID=UPI0033349D2C
MDSGTAPGPAVGLLPVSGLIVRQTYAITRGPYSRLKAEALALVGPLLVLVEETRRQGGETLVGR